MIYLYKIALFLLIFLFVSCASNRHIGEQQEVLSLDFIELKAPFEIIILDYTSAGCSCGGKSCASNTIGKTIDNDTIRILSLCNNDTTYQLGDRVKVIPTEKPNFNVMIAQYWLNDDKNLYIPEIQKNTKKTIYGKLIRL